MEGKGIVNLNSKDSPEINVFWSEYYNGTMHDTLNCELKEVEAREYFEWQNEEHWLSCSK